MRMFNTNAKKRSASRFMRNPYAIGVLFLLIIALVGGVAYILNQRIAHIQYSATDMRSLIARPVQPEDHVITGSPNSKVTLIVYSDLSCEYCRNFFKKTLPMLRTKYGNSFVTVYRHLPLASYPQSVPEAAAAECVARDAGEEAFLHFVGDVFSDPDYASGLSTSTLADLASRVGADRTTLIGCMTNTSILDRIRTDANEAAIAGLTIAPSFVVKSADRALTVSGNSYSRLDAAIAYLLEMTK